MELATFDFVRKKTVVIQLIRLLDGYLLITSPDLFDKYLAYNTPFLNNVERQIGETLRDKEAIDVSSLLNTFLGQAKQVAYDIQNRKEGGSRNKTRKYRGGAMSPMEIVMAYSLSLKASLYLPEDIAHGGGGKRNFTKRMKGIKTTHNVHQQRQQANYLLKKHKPLLEARATLFARKSGISGLDTDLSAEQARQFISELPEIYKPKFNQIDFGGRTLSLRRIVLLLLQFLITLNNTMKISKRGDVNAMSAAELRRANLVRMAPTAYNHEIRNRRQPTPTVVPPTPFVPSKPGTTTNTSVHETVPSPSGELVPMNNGMSPINAAPTVVPVPPNSVSTPVMSSSNGFTFEVPKNVFERPLNTSIVNNITDTNIITVSAKRFEYDRPDVYGSRYSLGVTLVFMDPADTTMSRGEPIPTNDGNLIRVLRSGRSVSNSESHSDAPVMAGVSSALIQAAGEYMFGSLMFGSTPEQTGLLTFNTTTGTIEFAADEKVHERHRLTAHSNLIEPNSENSDVIAGFHTHPFQFDRIQSQQSRADINVLLRRALATQITNEVIFTQGGVIVISLDTPTRELLRNVIGRNTPSQAQIGKYNYLSPDIRRMMFERDANKQADKDLDAIIIIANAINDDTDLNGIHDGIEYDFSNLYLPANEEEHRQGKMNRFVTYKKSDGVVKRIGFEYKLYSTDSIKSGKKIEFSPRITTGEAKETTTVEPEQVLMRLGSTEFNANIPVEIRTSLLSIHQNFERGLSQDDIQILRDVIVQQESFSQKAVATGKDALVMVEATYGLSLITLLITSVRQYVTKTVLSDNICKFGGLTWNCPANGRSILMRDMHVNNIMANVLLGRMEFGDFHERVQTYEQQNFVDLNELHCDGECYTLPTHPVLPLPIQAVTPTPLPTVPPAERGPLRRFLRSFF